MGVEVSMVNAEGQVIQRFEAPDTVHVAYIGDIDAYQMRTAAAEARWFVQSRPFFFALLDVSRLKSFTSEARRAAAENEDGARMRGLAIVGASFHFRVIGTLVARAVALIQRHVDNPLRFFSTEEEARGWFAERRRELEGAAHRPG